MFGPSLMNLNEFHLEVTNAVIARIIFSACWNIVWCIKTNFLFKFCMQWLQEYCFLHVGTFCDASKWILFWSIVFNDCKNTVFHMLGPSLMNQNLMEHCVMNQNEFAFEVLYAMIVRILFSICWMNQNEFSLEVMNAVIARILFSACWNIVWCIKTNFLLMYCMQWLQEYYFLHVGTLCDASKKKFLFKYYMQSLQECCFLHLTFQVTLSL